MDTKVFTDNGNYLLLALDHRENFKKLKNQSNPELVSDNEVIDDITRVIERIYTNVTGLVLDTNYSLPAFNKLNISKPFLLPAESTLLDKGKDIQNNPYRTASEIRETGASGIKLMVQLNPDQDSANQQAQLIKNAIDDAHSTNLPLFMGFLTYEMGDSEKVLRSVEYLLQQSVLPDVLVLEFPGSDYMCQRTTSILGETPWIMMTGGGDYVLFREQLMMASENGCRGFLAGRSLWQDYFEEKDSIQKSDFLTNTLPLRFNEMKKIVESL
jgi:tagatose 1,6-diphosphate aldolase